MFYYYQAVGGEEHWSAVPAAYKLSIQDKTNPMFFTVLSVSKLVEDLPHEEKLKLQYSGPLYFDFDSEDEELVIEKVNLFLDKLEDLKVDLRMCYLFATGGRGYHIEIPAEIFMERVPKTGVVNLAAIYREIALELCVDTLDMRVYSQGKGRMWRQPNVKRSNNRYKVSVTADEMRSMTPEICQHLTSNLRQQVPVKVSEFCVPLAILYSKAAQKVEELTKRRSKIPHDPAAQSRAFCDSIQWLMAGLGIKSGTGFQEISTQLAIAANTAGIDENAFIGHCAGLIEGHQGDGKRYNTPFKREEELRRMHRYMTGNLCYEFSVGAVKRLLSHTAPDLDGIQVSKEDVLEGIKEAEAETAESTEQVDEYEDVAKGITLSRFGVYADTEYGKKRICAISFTNVCVLKSAETDQIAGYSTDILVNGKCAGRQTLELEVFSGLQMFNRLAARYGHSFQGTDAQVRMLMMRFVESAKKKGNMQYIVKREGLDIVSIPNHENKELREPFVIWADATGVVAEPRIKDLNVNLVFAGYPDVRGVYKTDLRDTPNLAEWVQEEDNRAGLENMLRNLMTCQTSELLGKLLGWYTSCFWKQIFHKAYGKFPLLHVNGAAGAGKCLGVDTPVLMADGSIRKVQDIYPGEQLLGPDGKPRNVLSICGGREKMYKVSQNDGSTYTVNESHILSLMSAIGDVYNMSVKDYMKLPPMQKLALHGWKPNIALEFYSGRSLSSQTNLYDLGVALGRSVVSGKDKGLRVDHVKPAAMRERSDFLRGLLDTASKPFMGKHALLVNGEDLAEDLVFIIRSLGLAARKTKMGLNVSSMYHINIGGNFSTAPLMTSTGITLEKPNLVGIHVEALGVDDYYGFTIDGDHLFLLGDFTVTHNTEMNTTICNLFYHLGEPKLLSPTSTPFAIQQHLTASASLPMILDEYKPHEMNREVHNRLKLQMRDVYNQRDVLRGGGNRESEDYRSLQHMQLSAPMVFIAEAAEDEAAVMERVVLATVVKPAASQTIKWLHRFHSFRRDKHMLGILGHYMASEIVHEWSVDRLRDEFDLLYDEIKDQFLVTESDLAGGVSVEELAVKQNAKERSVYNHTVAKFGFRQFRRIVKQAVGSGLDLILEDLEKGIYDRMADLQSATTPEHVKVLSMFSVMSHHVDSEQRDAMRKGYEYDYVNIGGRECIEIAVKPAYFRYRTYCKNSSVSPLFSGAEAFAYALKDSPAYVRQGTGNKLHTPGVFVFDVNELAKLGVDIFSLK